MKRHTGIYVDLGYREETNIVLIKDDEILEIYRLVPQTDFEEVVSTVIGLARKHKVDPYLAKSRRFPALEEAVRYHTKANPFKE